MSSTEDWLNSAVICVWLSDDQLVATSIMKCPSQYGYLILLFMPAFDIMDPHVAPSSIICT